MSGLLNQEMSSEQMGRFKQLFQVGYNYIDQGENFDALLEHAKQDPKGAVSTFVSTLATKIIKQTGEKDLMVLMSSMLAVMSNVIDNLRELGIQISDDDMMEIINNSVQQTLGENPEFAQAVKNDPSVMQSFQQEPQTNA
ncbi:MAG: hypothetical protein GY829_06295 [Gammaproteobacteria bacterium]|nr:hypothetical protein [Gammaproteobacteria bacterium]